ncbi:ribosomal subunit interface protein [Kyrpidia spormannii]|uniref:Ribosome hibernation promoting factor n=1 Tax=Kyrpidia spormannii TaxID=2055160 RepID=A0A2K8N9Y0_9BACL|nr:ribosome-associated translation inhibitor RaiA [Kyrpidia spormannii]ATY85925.1 ribosomal subunit interface protein [Kyrpidia spormannii]
MRIHVRGDNLAVTEALREYAVRKVGRLEKYFDAPADQDVYVTLSVKRGLHKVEVTMTLGGIVFRAEEKSGDMYGSLDLVVDKLVSQAERHKSKINKRFRQAGIRTLTAEVEPPEESQREIAGEVVRVKRFPVKPMPVEEAILQMDLLGHDFFVFANADTDEVNVVYRRKDGNYGLIEPAF